MQFTGLKDKNGVEIYEGYIISWKEHVFMYGTDLNEWVTEKTAVEYSGIGAFVIWNNGEILYPTNEKSVVIGNIYENPDLLEASK